MKIAIGADHRGFDLKEIIKLELKKINEQEIMWHDVGTHDKIRSDYPVFAHAACKLFKEEAVEAAVLICGSGVGMAVVANRYPGVYAAVAWSEKSAQMSKEDDNTNVLVIPSYFVSEDQAISLIKVWLKSTFKGGRYAERISMIDEKTVK